MAELVSKKYAMALFEAGLDLEKIHEFNGQLEILEKIFKEHLKLVQIFSHPKIRKEEKKELIDKLFKDKVSWEIVNFLYVLIDKRRERHILDIIQEYKVMFNKHEEIVKVVAVTAIPMEERYKAKLKVVLSNKLMKKVELENMVDPGILGGVILKFENKLVDGSVKGKLEDLGKVIGGNIS